MRTSCLAAAIVVVFLSLQFAAGQMPEQSSPASIPSTATAPDGLTSAQRIEQLARRYRINVYNAFHTNRPQYDLHRAALDKALQAWRTAGSREKDAERLTTWLQRAIDSLRSHPPGPLPEIPEFAEIIRPKPLPPEKPPALAEKKPPAKPPVEPVKPPVPPAPVVKPTPPKPIEKPVLPKPVEPPLPPKPVEKPVPPKPVEPPAPPKKPVELEKPKEPAPAPLPGLPKIEDTAKPAPAPALPKPPVKIAPTVPEPKKEPPRYVIELPTLPKNIDLPKTPKPPVEHLATRSKSPPSLKNAARLPAGSSSRQSRNARPLPSVPADKLGQEPLGRSRQMPALPGLSRDDLAGLGKSDSSGVESKAAGDDSNTEINLIELAAQIAGTNMALRGMEAQLAKSRNWDSMQLEKTVDFLKQLGARRKDLTLFRDLLPENDRRLVGQLDSMRPAISECSDRVSDAQKRAKSKLFRGSEEDRQAELKKLDGISRELAKLVADL